MCAGMPFSAAGPAARPPAAPPTMRHGRDEPAPSTPGGFGDMDTGVPSSCGGPPGCGIPPTSVLWGAGAGGVAPWCCPGCSRVPVSAPKTDGFISISILGTVASAIWRWRGAAWPGARLLCAEQGLPSSRAHQSPRPCPPPLHRRDHTGHGRTEGLPAPWGRWGQGLGSAPAPWQHPAPRAGLCNVEPSSPAGTDAFGGGSGLGFVPLKAAAMGWAPQDATEPDADAWLSAGGDPMNPQTPGCPRHEWVPPQILSTQPSASPPSPAIPVPIRSPNAAWGQQHPLHSWSGAEA